MSGERKKQTPTPRSHPLPQEDITILNVYGSNKRGSNYIRQNQVELQGEIPGSTIMVGNFNILLSEMDRSGRQKFNEDIVEGNDTIHQLDITDIYRSLPPTAADYTLSSCSNSPRWTIC